MQPPPPKPKPHRPLQLSSPHPRETASKPSVELRSGFVARQAASDVLSHILEKHRFLDEAFTLVFQAHPASTLEPRDRAMVRLIVATVLRRYGELAAVLRTFLDKPLPEKRGKLWPILLSASAQLLILETPAHAAISLAVDECKADPGARRFDRLANAILRRTSERGREILAGLDPVALNVPAWMLERWQRAYGVDIARRIASASLAEAPLDLTVTSDPQGWAAKLGGVVLPNGSVRLTAHGRIEELDGYGDGAWWVQDAAAALPAKLLGDIRGLRVADICAAPGGKTAQLAAAGAHVTAVDASATRLERVKDNLARLGLAAELVTADATKWEPPDLFDAVLLDAPCSASGTIRRHPDILSVKKPTDLAITQSLQSRLLQQAATFVHPGGVLVYCVCSLEPEEGSQQIDQFLAAHPEFTRYAVTAVEVGGQGDWLNERGELRTLPFHLTEPGSAGGGLDGFFAARLRRAAA